MNTINYSNISKTVDYFISQEFKNIEVPWTVPVAILEITKPRHIEDGIIRVQDRGGLIASGEQGFLALANDGLLQPGKYVTTTPCFRDDEVDFTHAKQFLKVELIYVLEDLKDSKYNLDELIEMAHDNFKSLCSNELQIIPVDNLPNTVLDIASYDIELKYKDQFIEIGSYGIRQCEFCTWVYGTGIAEPRFSKLTKE